MKSVSVLLIASLAEGFPLFARDNGSQAVDYSSAPPNLTALAPRSLYDTWRPIAHIVPVHGSIGDPCMQYTDPSTGLFHAGFLHDDGASGATTDDLVTYTDLRPEGDPFIVAGGINDHLAVFDGSIIPEGVDGNATLLYTSVSYLPIQWTVPYTIGSETQSLAITSDGGRNFTKAAHGPVIASHPFGLNVTGFRDPYVFQSRHLDTMLRSQNGTWYVVISGGIHTDGPSQFLYRQYSDDFQSWQYLGQWWHEPANSTWSENGWAGRWGFNFETGNVLSLTDEGYSQDGDTFLTLGAEWSAAPIVSGVSDFRNMLWTAGNITTNQETPKYAPNMAGTLDWGTSAYAAAGKFLPATSLASQASGAPDRFISYLWLTGNFYGTLLDFPSQQQNWTGLLLLPRELSVGRIRNVVNNDLVKETGSWRVTSNTSNAVVDLSTLGQDIAREPLAAFRNNTSWTEPGRTTNGSGVVTFSHTPDSKFFLLETSLQFPSSARNSSAKVGFQLLAGEHEQTTIYYQFSNESIVVDRSNTSAAALDNPDIPFGVESGKLRLFDIADSGDASDSHIETLNLTIVIDNAVAEIHANGRFALATWLRSWYSDSREIRFFQEGEGEVTYGESTVYEGLVDAWPHRS